MRPLSWSVFILLIFLAQAMTLLAYGQSATTSINNPQAASASVPVVQPTTIGVDDTPSPPSTDAVTYKLEVVTTFSDFQPRGVAVSADGRIFVCFPRMEVATDYTVG